MSPDRPEGSTSPSGDDQPLPASASAILEAHRPPFQSPPALALRQFVRRNLLIVISGLIFIGVAVLVVVQIDEVYYQDAKRDMLYDLVDQQQLLSAEEMRDLNMMVNSYVENYLAGRQVSLLTQQKRFERLNELQIQANEILGTFDYVWKIELLDADRRVILDVSDRARLARQNTWRNCLITRDFSTPISTWKTVLDPETKKERRVALLSIYMTTPTDNGQIIALTNRWRWRSAWALAGLAALYGLLFWGVLLPMRNVVKALDKGTEIGAPIIAHPRALLEKYYNNLARDATLSIYSTGLRSFLSRGTLVDHRRLNAFAPKLGVELFPFPAMEIWVVRSDEDQDRWEREAVFDGGDGKALSPGFAGELLSRLETQPASLHPEEWHGEVFDFRDGEGRRLPWFAGLVQSTEGHATVMAVEMPARRPGSVPWWADLCRNLARELHFASLAIGEQRRLILQEKSKANISLSRNIGHDLTNIIATSKLELMSMKTLLEMPLEDLAKSPKKARIFRESLESLLNNTRFLQETVNLYRSFTYLSRPKFESVDVNELVSDVAVLFKLSLSKNIAIETDLDRSLDSVTMEPRLIRLALFNLLSNAADSIKRGTSAERPAGTIVIRTGRRNTTGEPEIAVQDSGGGIRDSEGNLLDPHEIEEIFQLGYSTKEKSTSEGLGLNWVQQIVHEFHGGEIAARNLPEGGAAFAIAFKRRDWSGVQAPDLLQRNEEQNESEKGIET